MENRFHSKIFWIILFITAGIITLNGILTDVGLGDESHHYQFAQNIYWAGKRVPYASLYGSGNPPGFFYNDPPLWHFILAYLWKVTGGISQAIAQIYHILFFILLVWVTSLLAREISGEEGRWSSALILTTVPMVVSFSTLFYMDIPMAALATLSFYFILKKRYIEAGVFSGLAYFTKLNFGFFLPGFLLLILWNEKKRFLHTIKSLAFFILPVLMIYIPDSYWRKLNIRMNVIGWANVSYRLSMVLTGIEWREYLNSYLTNPVDIVKYFGIVFLFLFIFHFFHLRRWNKKDAVLWVPVISYFVLFIIFFGVVSDIRYLIPILPFLVALAVYSFSALGKRWQVVMIGICLLQFGSTMFYVHQKRQISPEVKEGFAYVGKNVPQEALILYPEENLLIYGQRRIIWTAVGASEGYRLAKKGLQSLFWPNSVEEMGDILRADHIDYILIKKSRIYEDHEKHHIGGYPKSFVEKLPHLDGWMKIFENSGVALWKRIQ
jgi:4-amino-4-deoxy-L-arabinose transferase-like glycosyltransferase